MTDNLYETLRIIHRSEYSWRPTKVLRSLKTKADHCPRCATKLYTSETSIPVHGENVAVITGQKCQHCDCLYIADYHEVAHLLRDNKNAKEYTLDGIQLWNYTARRKDDEKKRQRALLRNQKSERLRSIPSGALLLTVCFDSAEQDYIIVNKKNEQDESKSILHYSNPLALEILTAAFHESRNRQGNHNGQAYRIDDIIYPQAKEKELSESFLPTALSIKYGGGMYRSSVESEDGKEIVDVLLYSPFTERYETVFATYERYENCCYMDASLYREFVAKYGKPDITTRLGERNYFGSYDMEWSDLQAESPLQQYGYSVSENKGLSDRHRQVLLAELVDLELIEIPKIVRYLDFFISSHPSLSHKNACLKWQSDKAFISAYKANPERFLIKLLCIKGD